MTKEKKTQTVELEKGGVVIDVPFMTTHYPLIKRPTPILSRRQAKALRAVFDGLQEQGELVNDKLVKNPNDAIRWILDRVADSIEEELGAFDFHEKLLKKSDDRAKKRHDAMVAKREKERLREMESDQNKRSRNRRPANKG